MNTKPQVKISSWLRAAAVGLGVIALAAMSPSTAQVTTDQDFRLLNIERRLDQIQVRVALVERAQQNQAAVAANTGVATQTLLEMQRQQLALMQEVALLQQSLLQLQKKMDQLSARIKEPDKKEPDKSEKPPEKKQPDKGGQVIKDK
jgi:hypothetical protein